MISANLKNILLSVSALLCMFPLVSQSQNLIEDVRVETYYISDENDEAALDGGVLEAGSVTYRVFVKLATGVKLRAIYGSPSRVLSISSTELFYNNEDRGESWGFDIPDNRLDENTVALDSWLSFGGATDEHWGVEKALDTDGSIVGGVNHEDGLLVNNTPEIGITLPEADGLIQADNTAPINFISTGDDLSAVFGEQTLSNTFQSNNFRAQCAGVELPQFDNEILVAQFTTKGELSFCLNLELINPQGVTVNYVSTENNLDQNEVFSNFLCYPPSCGCTDPFYLEFDPAAICDDGSCATEIIFGCSNPLACNFDPAVNFNVDELCCILPDDCFGLEPELICPGATVVNEEDFDSKDIVLFPNPARESVQVQFKGNWSSNPTEIEILDIRGKRVYHSVDSPFLSDGTISIPLSFLESGIYVLRVIQTGNYTSSRFVCLK